MKQEFNHKKNGLIAVFYPTVIFRKPHSLDNFCLLFSADATPINPLDLRAAHPSMQWMWK